jgi:SAM-dependent methyltransferase
MTQQEFLDNPNNDTHFRILLWLALNKTTGNVLELGCGYGSTPYLQRYCKENDRYLLSCDSKQEWAEKFRGAVYYQSWDTFDWSRRWDVVLVDHAPGEHRQIAIQLLKPVSKILVIHDTEPAADHGYQMRQHFSKFRYCVEIKTDGAWTTMLSDTINLSEFEGLSFTETPHMGGYLIQKYIG